jgi:hypothetical protein
MPKTDPPAPTPTPGDTPPAPAPAPDSNPTPDPPAPTPTPGDTPPAPAPAPDSNPASGNQDDFVNMLAQERFISHFLADEENAKKYPDIKLDDLKHVLDPNDVPKEAERLQNRLNAHAQAKIYEIENPVAPRLSPEDIAEQERQLAEKPDKNSFTKLIGLRLKSAK